MILRMTHGKLSARHGQQGLTLVELLTTLAIGSVLMHLGMGSMQNWTTHNLLTTQSNTLMSNIILARSEAVKRNTRVTLRNKGATWQDGWTVFVDANDNGTLDGGEQVLAEQNHLPGRLTLHGNRPLRHYLSYVGTGQSQRISGAIQAGRFMLCDQSGQNDPQHARAIVISSTGRPRISKQRRDLRSCT